jgi:ABC-type transport system involved in cytochrome c biogenesis permease subunit
LSQAELAELSRILYSPVTLSLYLAAAFVYLYALTTTVGRREERARGRRAQMVGGVLAVLGLGTHVGHEIVRGMAQSRLPLGNMFEVTSLMALVGIVVGLGYLQFVRKRPELNGFVLLGGALVLASALLMYSAPGPLMPILDTWWRSFHVSLLVGGMGIFTAGFIFNGLYLLRDTGERAVAASRSAVTTGSTVGAAYVGDLDGTSAEAGTLLTGDDDDDEAGRRQDAEYRAALRRGVSAPKLAMGTFAGTALVSWVWLVSSPTVAEGMGRFLTVNLVMVAAALIARWFVPFLPPAATLDGLAHRTIAFGFVAWTVGTIAGAMWAEQSWGRFWGWDPKETGAFLTWVAYAGYLHARATRGVRGRGAAWIGLGAFVVMMATYLVANYVIVGLHSYAGL